jgi:hypothetical protein
MEASSTFSILNESDIVWRVVDSEILILNVATGAYYSGNSSARVIWQGLVEKQSLAQLIDSLEAQVEAPRQLLEKDCLEFIAELLSAGVIAERK